MRANNITFDKEASLEYDISASLPITYHTQLHSWLNSNMESIGNLYYQRYELIHSVQQHLFMTADYDEGETVWVAMEVFQLDGTANEEFEKRNSGEIKTSVVGCNEQVEQVCMIEIMQRETKFISLSLTSTFITSTFTISINEEFGNPDTLHFSKPEISLGNSYRHTPEDTITIKKGPPSDSGLLEQNSKIFHTIYVFCIVSLSPLS